MSRRSSKKLDTQLDATDSVDTTVTPKTGRKVVKVETTRVITTSKAKPKKQVKPDNDSDDLDDSDDEPQVAHAKELSTTRKINRVRAKVATEEADVPKQNANC